jgi:aryl-alcohol dehydrogenase-like predicted oxidoreductase
MQYSSLGHLENISRLTLGGGGLGQVWGETSQAEAIETVHAAIESGINLLDTAPMYRSCETVIRDAFAGQLPEGISITTKCQLGEVAKGTVSDRLTSSLEASLSAMGLDRVDVYFLHSYICEDDEVFAFGNENRAKFATPWSQYVDEVVPAFEALQKQGMIGGWGITGTGVPATILKALQHTTKPSIVQAITNLLNSAGALKAFAGPVMAREIIREANNQGVGVMGIRAVQAGALTDAIDRPLKDSHPEVKDFNAAAPFRVLCQEIGEPAAAIAHRYALDMDGVDSVVLGVKNKAELAECVAAEAAGKLPADILQSIKALNLTRE